MIANPFRLRHRALPQIVKTDFWGGHFLILVLTGLNWGCADPKYAVRAGREPSSVAQSEVHSLQCHIRFQKLGGCLNINWLEGPRVGEDDRLVAKLHRPNQFDQSPTLFDSGEVNLIVEPTMPSMGHGTDETEVEKHDVGTFEVRKIFFSMSGSWRIEFRFVGPGGEALDSGYIDVSVD